MSDGQINLPDRTVEKEFNRLRDNLLSAPHGEEIYNDFLFSGMALARGTAPPTLTELRDGIFMYAFNGSTTMNQGFFTIHLLHGLKAGSALNLHVHWTHNNASPSGSIKWSVDYSTAKGYGIDTFGAPTTASTIQAAGAQYAHMITNDDDIVITDDVEPDTILMGRIYRDPTDVADTFADDAFLLHVDIHYVADKVGTTSRNRPFVGF